MVNILELIKEELLQSDSTFYCLYAEILSWKYHSSLSAPGASAEKPEPGISIEAVNVNCDVLKKDLPLWLGIIDSKPRTNYTIPVPLWELWLIPSTEDPALPANLQVELPVSEETMRDMKDCLFLNANSAGCTMQIQLTVQEKENSPDNIAERTFSIIEFSYELIHRRNNL